MILKFFSLSESLESSFRGVSNVWDDWEDFKVYQNILSKKLKNCTEHMKKKR
jgi:hypothetical protein